MPSRQVLHKWPEPCCKGRDICGCCIWLSHHPECYAPKWARRRLKAFQGEYLPLGIREILSIEDIQVKREYL